MRSSSYPSRVIRALIVLTALLAVPFHQAWAQPGGPSNDDFGDAEEISSLPFAKDQLMLNASRQEDEPGSCITSGTVWFKFTPSQDVAFDAQPTGDYDLRIGVFTGSSLSTLQKIACDYTYYGPRFMAKAGTTYFLQVGTQYLTLTDLNVYRIQFKKSSAITGTLTDTVSGEPIQNECVYGFRGSSSYYNSLTRTDSTGRYDLISGITAGPWYLMFGCTSSLRVQEFYSDKATRAEADAVTVVAEQVTAGIHAALARKGMITGTVRDDSGTPLKGICVAATPRFAGGSGGSGSSKPDGTFEVGVRGSGGFTVSFTDCVDGDLRTEFYDGKPSAELSDPVAVVQGETTSGIDAVLERKPIPSNDSLADAKVITEAPFDDQADLSAAMREPEEPMNCSSYANTLWYKYIPDASGTYSIDAKQGPSRVSVTVFQTAAQEPSFGDLTFSSCSYPWASKEGLFALEQGKVYFIQVSGSTRDGNMDLRLRSETRPANDDAASAVSVDSLPFSATVRVAGASGETGEQNSPCYYSGSTLRTVWYRFTGDGGQVKVTGDSVTVWDSIGSVRPSVNKVACSGAPIHTEVGKTYWVQVAERYSSWDASLTIERGSLPDNFDEAVELPGSATQTFAVDNRSATVETGEPTNCGAAAHSVWYRWTPGSEGIVMLDSFGTSVNTVIGVYTGSNLATLRLVNCNDDTYKSNTSALGLHVKPGQTYFIQVATRSSWSGGAFNVSLSQATSETPISFAAAQPCAIACPYWSSPSNNAAENEAACQPTPSSVPGSWSDVTVTVPDLVDGKAPTGLVFRLVPAQDFDGFLCRATADGDGKYFVTTDANTTDQFCGDIILFGCEEAAVARVKPGDVLVLRVYNWADTSSAPTEAAYSFRT